MELIVTDMAGMPAESHASYSLDLAYGSGENDFSLQVGSDAIGVGSIVMIDGTGYGGIVDDMKVDVESAHSTVTWQGRDWHGVLASKIVEPDPGADYLTISGTVPYIIRTLVARAGLQDLFHVTDDSSSVTATVQADRYADLHSVLTKTLRNLGLRLRILNDGDRVSIGAPAIRTIGDGIDSDLLDFTALKAGHPVNHLVCLGKGELKDRTVIHWYADPSGALGHTQTLTGLDEVAATYELSNAEADELETEGRRKLLELRAADTIDAEIPDGIDADVGDLIVGRDNNTGLTATAEITKKIVKVSNGTLSVTYEAGTASIH